ncbi:TolC family protein [Carboxylicivirga sediminis]|uniref:TolC family protein n=1 Tax=Carboxylicivirga sediminis TaxID=2006564 RepID=A0A941F3B2_9BACT|nr:TolC family protein [Carboxylicivirga sediminis]MBR8536016.1 TolC family protein [Carboxylicivirga sediminis]
MKTKYISTLLLAWICLSANSQEVLPDSSEQLTLQKAVEIAMVNNYDIKIASGELQKAQNLNSAGNAGLLPSVSLSGGADYSNKDTEMELLSQGSDGSASSVIIEQDNAASTTYNANARIDYTLFDGFGNIYTYKKLQSADALQETIFRQQTEATIVQVAQEYYQVCRSQQNLHLAKESMRISRERWQKAIDQKAYGQATQLDVLNAEVDMNNDSTTVLQTEQTFIQSLKNLNLVLGIPIQSSYEVDNSISYRDDLTADNVVAGALMNNARLVAQQQQEQISEFDVKIANAGKYPTLSAYGQYGYYRQDNDAGQLLYNQNLGTTAGVSLKFNVFNGSQQRTREKNAKLDFINQQERTYQVKSEIERDASNAYTDYIYKRRIVELQKSSLEQARLNFEQTQELFQLGRVTSIEFRTAQQNLLKVAANYNDAQFQAKTAEFYLLQLSGQLVQ